MRADARTVKMRALITTVDPSQRLIHVKSADGEKIVSVLEVPTGFTWPREGETWSIYKENMTWILGSRLQNVNDQRKIEDLLPGQSLAPAYYEQSVPVGSLYLLVPHLLGSKALQGRLRPSQVGAKVMLSTDIPSSLTSGFAADEVLTNPDEVRHTGSGYMKLDDEIIIYSSSSIGSPTATFTSIQRGRLGTTATDHAKGTTGTLFAFTGSVVQPTYELQPVSNDLAMIKFATTTTIPLDLAIIG